MDASKYNFVQVGTPKREDVEVPGILGGNLGRELIKEGKELVRLDYNDNQSLFPYKVDESTGLVIESSTFGNILLNKLFRKFGLLVHTSRARDLGKIVQENILDLNGTYEDAGIVVRGEGELNGYLAQDVIAQVKEQYGNKYSLPFMIDLTELDLVNDSNSRYKVKFKLLEGAEVVSSKKLAGLNDGRSFNETDKRGIPIFKNDGKRAFYANSDGLSRLILFRDLDLCSYFDGLAVSNSVGRVVVVSDEVAPQKQ